MKLVDSSCLICVFKDINKPYILMDWREKGHEIIITEQIFEELQENADTKKKGNIRVDKRLTVKSSY